MGYIPKLIKTTDLAADLITGAKLADDAIDSEHYADGSIDTAHIGNLQVTTGKIAADAITGAKIADDAIDSEHYTDGSIDNAHIADDAIDSEHYVDGSIDTAHIANDAVTLAKMASGTDGNIISYDASGNPVAIATGNDGQVLTSTGAGSPPAFEDAGGGGSDVDADGWFRRLAGVVEVSDATVDFATSVHLGSNLSESAGTITIGTAGWYLVMFRMHHYSNDSNDVQLNVYNGATQQTGTIEWDVNADDQAGTGFALVDCSASDTIHIKGYGKFEGRGSGTLSEGYFSGFRIGDT